ncbi:apolipoprotein N-acyltransferase [Tropicimonas sp.]|uniref:apolipoprotein N-acyltransferase n=1 Tax=Tropicimonas sp. TaxID=2067044 RepID=UPI003A88D68A
MAAERLKLAISGRAGLVAAFPLGAATAAGQPPLGWTWFAVAALAAGMALFTLPDRWPGAAWRGWAFGTGYFAAALFWIVEPFLVDIARHGWMAPFALFLMSGGLALFWALAFGLAARFGTGRRRRAAWLVVTLTAVEMLRSVIFTGFPWALIGHIWIGAPQMQIAAIAGAPGLTLITLAGAALPALAGARRALPGTICALALLSLAGGYGKLRVPTAPAPTREPPVTVRLVQPNAAQHLKWDPDMMPVFFRRGLDLTAAPPAGAARPDVVIWPETALPEPLQFAGPAFRQIAGAAQGALTVLGVQRVDDRDRWFNSLVVLAPDGTVGALYDKYHLVPFGEYMPLLEVFARWGISGLAANGTGGYSRGPGPQLIGLGPAGRALPLICYEAIFPNDIARAPARADWLLQITNDAWFGRLSGPYQHLALARLRAVEQGLPLMRAANTGISAGFDPYGRELERLPLGTAGFVDVPLAAPLAPTPYSRFGDWPVLLILALVAGLLSAVSRRRIPLDRASKRA